MTPAGLLNLMGIIISGVLAIVIYTGPHKVNYHVTFQANHLPTPV